MPSRPALSIRHGSIGWLLALVLALAIPAVAEAAQPELSAAAAAPSTLAHQQDNIIVVLDASGSMREMMRPAPGGPRRDRMSLAKEAIAAVLAPLPPQTNVGIYVFSGRGIRDPWVYPLGRLEIDRLRAALAPIRPEGATPLGDALRLAANALLRQRQSQFGYGTYRLLVVTDGQASDPELVERFTPELLSRGIVLDVVGVAMDQDHVLATRAHAYRRAGDAQSLQRALSDSLAEIQSARDVREGEDDFEILRALPDEAALPILAALTRVNNIPIGDQRASDSAPLAGAAPSAAPAAGPPTSTSAPTASRTAARTQPPPAGTKPSFVYSPFTIILGIVIAVVVLSALRGASSKGWR